MKRKFLVVIMIFCLLQCGCAIVNVPLQVVGAVTNTAFSIINETVNVLKKIPLPFWAAVP